MKRPNNSRKAPFLATIQSTSIYSDSCSIAKRCKFNFHYFDNSQEAGQDFSDWSKQKLEELLNKLKHYSERSLEEWTRERIGGGGLHVLEIYDRFPARSAFRCPTYVPIEARWARFRLEGDMRLVGFILPNECRNAVQRAPNYLFDCNTFYVVFLDENHRFYITT